MCGIAGLASWRHDPTLEPCTRAMNAALAHRGPDGEGVWFDRELGVGLGHRRLAIIDLSASANQPMTCASGRRVIVYNGEIYNFASLRAELEQAGQAPRWRSHSDTEVLLAAIEAWGVESALARVVGMFAFALWDRDAQTLTLARDRMGEKPLYFGAVGGRLVFASELKAILAAGGGRPAIDRRALAACMRFGYVPAPLSIYEGIAKLAPGHCVTLRSAQDQGLPRPYWTTATAEVDAHAAAYVQMSDEDLLQEIHDRLSNAVGGQMIADVPLGAFLSGGIDSSLVVSLMQAHSPRRVRTFTIGFREGGFDEAPYARAVAQHLGTEHTEIYVGPNDAAALVPALSTIYDEPFADSSQIPSVLVSRLTRQHVTVTLSGDGGDELFAGYPRYEMTAALWRRSRRAPALVRKAIAATLTAPSPAVWERVLSAAYGPGPGAVHARRIRRVAQLIGMPSLEAMYVRLMSRWAPEDGLVLGAGGAPALAAWNRGRDPIHAMRLWDLAQYLPDDLLVKVDRAAMSASLETRAPMLDHRVVELALALPPRMLNRNGQPKWALRQLLSRHVPPKLFDRPKAGFEVPLAAWLRGPLRAWAADLIDPARLAQEGLLDASRISRTWQQHLSGQADHSQHLWNVLMFCAWNRDTSRSPAAQPGPSQSIAA
jgi:asparagine synthase (glutamine-hydrolysing)